MRDTVPVRIVDGATLSVVAAHGLAMRLVAAFGYAYPSWTIDEAGEEIRNGEGLPLTLCVLGEQDEVIACASLLADDEVSDCADVTPWLGNVFVLPEARGQGTGSLLVAAVLERAWQLGFDSVHLVSDAAQDWYRARGWINVGEVKVHGHPMQHMRIDRPSTTILRGFGE